MSDMETTEGKLLSEQFGVGGPPAEVKARPLAVIEAELDMLKQDTRQKETALLCNYIEIGRRLEEAKGQLAHGQWGGWLKKMEVAQSTANNFMLLYRKYGDEQQSLFGAQAKSQTFGSLTYSKALKLLAIEDEEERKRFVVENDVEHMSVRELDKALKARDEAEEKAAAAEDESRRLRQKNELLQEELAGQAQVYEAKLTSAGVEADQARAAAKDAQEALDKQKDKAQRLQDALSKANAAAQAAENKHARLARELEELKKRPVDVAVEVDQEAVETARKAAIAEMTEKVKKAKDAKEAEEGKRKAAEAALESARKELAELKAKESQARELTQEEKDALTAEAVNKAKAESEQQVQNLKKQLSKADPDTNMLLMLTENWQETFTKIWATLRRIEETDKEKAEKLRDGIREVLANALEHMT